MPTVHLFVSSVGWSNSSHMGSNLTQPALFCWSESGRTSLTRLGRSERGPFSVHCLMDFSLNVFVAATTIGGQISPATRTRPSRSASEAEQRLRAFIWLEPFSPSGGCQFSKDMPEEVLPRLRSSIPQVVSFVGSEDAQELVQDGIAMAARLMHNVEMARKKVTSGNIAYYTVRHLRSGWRSTGSLRADGRGSSIIRLALRPGFQLTVKKA